MENLKVYVSYGEEKGLMSIMVTDENVYEKNAVMRDLRYKQVIFNEEVMLELIEEYIVRRGYCLTALEVSDEEEKSDAQAVIQEIKENRMMIYKLWKHPIEGIVSIVLEKDEDVLSICWNGRYTYSDQHREIIQNVVYGCFKS